MWGRGERAALRGNALVRRTDRARKRLRRTLRWTLVLLAVPAAAVGAWTRAATAPQLASAAAHRHAVTATVLGRAAERPSVNAARVPQPGARSLEVEWTYPAGRTNRATVRPTPGTVTSGGGASLDGAGSTLTVWVDDEGRLASPPPTAVTETVNSVVYGLGAWGLGGLLAVLTHVLLRRRLDVRDARAWEQGWAQVEPYWSGRRHGIADR